MKIIMMNMCAESDQRFSVESLHINQLLQDFIDEVFSRLNLNQIRLKTLLTSWSSALHLLHHPSTWTRGGGGEKGRKE